MNRHFNGIILMAMIMILACIMSKQVHAKDFNFRDTYWGMSSKDVQDREFEKSGLLGLLEVKKHGNIAEYIYADTIAEIDVEITYVFVNDKLFGAKYDCKPSGDPYKCFGDGATMREILERKYGKTKVDILNNTRHKLNELSGTEIAEATRLGLLFFNYSWSLPETMITLDIHGDSTNVKTSVEYGTTDEKLLKELDYEENNYEENKGQNDF